MALLGILRWREQYTVLASVTGASRNSIGGAFGGHRSLICVFIFYLRLRIIVGLRSFTVRSGL